MCSAGSGGQGDIDCNTCPMNTFKECIGFGNCDNCPINSVTEEAGSTGCGKKIFS